MCLMCTYYNRIDLKELPTSNPFRICDDLDSPSEPVLPINIIVESPQSQRHVAWQNPLRFPSLHRDVVTSDNQPTITAATGSIYGPRQLSRPPRKLVSTSQGRKSPPPHIKAFIRPVPMATGQRKLQHHDRIASFSDATVEASEHGQSSLPSTPRSQSSISDEDEFSYLASPTTMSPSTSLPTLRSTQNALIPSLQSLGLAGPNLLDSRLDLSASPDWMAQMCQNL